MQKKVRDTSLTSAQVNGLTTLQIKTCLYDMVHFAFMVKLPKVHATLIMNTLDIPYK